jgi:hypothetical protein
MKKDKEIVVKVTPEGSLGLLALGHVGLDKWREALKEKAQNSKKGNDGKEARK